VIRTKRVPLVGRDVAAYAEQYRASFAEHRHRRGLPLTMLDPAPRIVLDPELGMLTVGRTAKDAAIAADIYHHTMPVLERSEDHLGGYVALPPGELFDLEYWDLEQAKLRLAGPPAPMAGTVALVTGAASGIGRACVTTLSARGAALVGLDRDRSVESLSGPASLGIVADVTDPEQQRLALAAAVERFGGVDVVVVSAGVFGASVPIDGMPADEWRRVFAVNVDAVASLFSIVHPVLRESPVGGRVAVVASKNVPAPGRGAAAYSSSKAALTQLCRVAALEWADDGIRVNVVHPDAVFDTGLWTPELLAERAAWYGLTVDDYKRRNLLRTEVTARGVAEVVVALCSDAFSATTGAQVPVDGGNERVV
jgi:NAD(P)-dependent dehydrogenase (short-subunit alcohol dehydrogenase family)